MHRKLNNIFTHNPTYKTNYNRELVVERREGGCARQKNNWRWRPSSLGSFAYSTVAGWEGAGCRQWQGAPQTEPKGSDATKIVEIPLDIVMKYHFRVQSKAAKMPFSAALTWVTSRDLSDREVWVDKFRNGTETLGEVILATTAAREAMWELPAPMPQADRRAPPQQPRKDQPRREERPNGQLPVLKPNTDKPKSKTWAKKLKDGSVICNKYSANKCAEKACRFAHKCAVVLEGGRVCGGSHPASQHRKQ